MLGIIALKIVVDQNLGKGIDHGIDTRIPKTLFSDSPCLHEPNMRTRNRLYNLMLDAVDFIDPDETMLIDPWHYDLHTRQAFYYVDHDEDRLTRELINKMQSFLRETIEPDTVVAIARKKLEKPEATNGEKDVEFDLGLTKPKPS